MTPEDEALEREALRVYRRYEVEIVEGLGFCPWAERARLDGRVRVQVVLEPTARERTVHDLVERLGSDPDVDIGLLLFPRVGLGRLPWERFVRGVRTAYEDGHERGGAPMAFAAFHPEAEPDFGDAARLVPFLRRSPDPTIQLVRRSVLEHVRRAEPQGTGFVDPSMLSAAALDAMTETRPLHERVHEAALERIRQRGVDEVAAMLDDIRRDRDEAYARIARGSSSGH